MKIINPAIQRKAMANIASALRSIMAKIEGPVTAKPAATARPANNTEEKTNE